MPRANSRSSASACSRSSCAAPARDRAGVVAQPAASRSLSESPTSRCCAPSCKSRSIRRRSASAALDDAPATRAPRRAARAPRRRGARSRARGRRSRDRVHELGFVEQRRVVHERGDRRARRHHLRHRPLARLGELHRPAVAVDPAAIVSEPVGDLEPRIAERAGEAITKRRCTSLLEIDDEAGDARPPDPRPSQPSEIAERDEDADDPVDREEGVREVPVRVRLSGEPDDGGRNGQQTAYEEGKREPPPGSGQPDQANGDQAGRRARDAESKCSRGLADQILELQVPWAKETSRVRIEENRRQSSAGNGDPCRHDRRARPARPEAPFRIRQQEPDDQAVGRSASSQPRIQAPSSPRVGSSSATRSGRSPPSGDRACAGRRDRAQ